MRLTVWAIGAGVPGKPAAELAELGRPVIDTWGRTWQHHGDSMGGKSGGLCGH